MLVGKSTEIAASAKSQKMSQKSMNKGASILSSVQGFHVFLPWVKEACCGNIVFCCNVLLGDVVIS